MRLIDADQFGVVSFQNKSEDFIDGACFILDKIYEAPTIEERPHGEWLEKTCTPFGTCWATCSVCNKFSYGEGHCNVFEDVYFFPDFCPKCGADMRGDAE